MTWICANCGTRHEQNDPPCRNCAHEQFAKLDESQRPDRVESSGSVHYRCTDCGATHPRHSPPCDNCGGMNFATKQGTPQEFTAGKGAGKQGRSPRLRSVTTTALYVVAVVVVLYVGMVIATQGVVPGSGALAGLTGPSIDTYDDADVESDHAFGTDLDAVEEAALIEFESATGDDLQRVDSMDAFAAYTLRYYATEGSLYNNTVQNDAARHYGTECVPGTYYGSIGSWYLSEGSPTQAAGTLVDTIVSNTDAEDVIPQNSNNIGVSVAKRWNGDVYLVISYC